MDVVKSISSQTPQQIRREVEAKAIQKAVEAGAEPNTVIIVESDILPVAYTTDRCRFYVKAAGEWTGIIREDSDVAPTQEKNDTTGQTVGSPRNGSRNTGTVDPAWLPAEILEYRPRVLDGQWFLSELDLEFIAIGTFILGCGGGGDPYQSLLAGRELIRRGAKIKVVDYRSLPSTTLAGWGGSFGSPEVISERLVGEE